MDLTPAQQLDAAARAFPVTNPRVDARAFGSGHINGSFRVAGGEGGSTQHYLLQRLNTAIFQNVAALMSNVERVTQHLAAKVAGEPDAQRRVLTLMSTQEGRTWHQEPDGSCWRMFRLIEGAHSFDAVETTDQAFRAAQAFGHFQRLLADLPAPRLHETIPGFHDTAQRFRALEAAIAADVVHRAATAADDITFALHRKPMCDVLPHAGLPERVTHNDTKLNNVLFDDSTGQALCVVDLDTVMPGLALYDFGDMVRTATSRTAEDEADLQRVTMQLPFFQALVEGYLSSAGGFLSADEKALLPFAGKLIAFEQAVRFLTDYLSGDVYYPVTDPGQNLRRCRTQMKLLQSMEAQAEAMQAVVDAAIATHV